mmetsp:Transcript_21778/g.52659  ORF Transcript_21778/g.52659 Transcript_21778/m.52659 type:complete len:534 (+) Transcript_21778:52-1653(+)
MAKARIEGKPSCSHRSKGHGGGGLFHSQCLLPLTVALLSLLTIVDSRLYSASATSSSETSQCSLSEQEFRNDPAVRTMNFDLGYGPQEFRAYAQPDVSEFYREPPGTRMPRRPNFNGWAAKFVNMSTQRIRLFWDPNDGRPGSPMSVMGPFNSAGTASFPGHAFYLTPASDETVVLARFVMKPPQAVYYYDPITVEGDAEATQANLDKLTHAEFEAYQEHVDSRNFGKQYFDFTGREYLAIYPRNAPSHKIWRADYFGQEHWVTTRETHYIDMPHDDELGHIDKVGSQRILEDAEPRLLEQYRSPEPVLNMTLKVLSCAPRAFEISNFLSQTEVDHIMYLTTGMKLHRSTTAGDSGPDPDRDQSSETRTSLNTWVYREKDTIIDSIYRRAADLLRIDEALLRPRSADEHAHLSSTRSLAEALQLVHYDPGQEYTAHHDFGYADFSRKDQPARFATLLLYLNEGMEGGATEFPRWVNADTPTGLRVEPKVGNAVLFYSQLPDGNMDDWSHHAALPVRKGEKWLMNLWVWDPEYN